jgi:3',5'-cyclic AMP phosphodiesterase CpdA
MSTSKVALRAACAAIVLSGVLVAAQVPATQPPPAGAPPQATQEIARPIAPPAKPLPPEAESAGVTKFSFIAYGDTRSSSEPGVPGDGQVVQVEHFRLMDFAIAKIESLAATQFPVRFVLQSGDAVLRGANGTMWNVSFTPIIERLTQRAGLPYFLSAGNHDVTGMPLGSLGRDAGLRNTLNALSNLIPAEGSPRRMTGYPTYAFGYGNMFVIAFDSNIAADQPQFDWVKAQLEGLDRRRYQHVIAFFHHPPFSSGPHGGTHVEPGTTAVRDLYMPLFRRHHVRMVITGHEHFYEHWIERYQSQGRKYRIDQLVTGGGGAPTYVYAAEPDLDGYVRAGADAQVALEHAVKPGPTAADNPHHFVLIQVDGDRLTLEVVGSGATYAPYNGRSRIELVDRVS